MKTQNLISKKILICTLAPLVLSCAKTNFVSVEPVESVQATPTPAAPDNPNKVVTSTEVVEHGNKKVDFLLVLDDSNSMLPELKKLSLKMTAFVKFLEASQIDWQMCVTTTRPSYAGKALPWKNYAPEDGGPVEVLKKGTHGLPAIFITTINSVTIGGGDSADERGLNAVYQSFAQGGPCYRPGAAASVILISDEDERSVGGDSSVLKPNDADSALKALEKEDLPVNILAQAHARFGDKVRFTFNSIIVKPGDKACEAQQDQSSSPSHPGRVYAEMSRLTEGGIGSICDEDYGVSLNTFKDKIINSLSQLSLECEPVAGTLKVAVNGVAILSFKLDGNILKFFSQLVEGTRIELNYECKK